MKRSARAFLFSWVFSVTLSAIYWLMAVAPSLIRSVGKLDTNAKAPPMLAYYLACIVVGAILYGTAAALLVWPLAVKGFQRDTRSVTRYGIALWALLAVYVVAQPPQGRLYPVYLLVAAWVGMALICLLAPKPAPVDSNLPQPGNEMSQSPAALPVKRGLSPRAKEGLKLAFAIVLGLTVPVGYFVVWPAYQEKKAEKEAVRLKALNIQRVHDAMFARIDALQGSRALPPCPMIYPLLDAQGRVTPLGSYLSYFAMKQASYLPQTAFKIPNAGEIYNEFDLFTEGGPKQEAYLKQLPHYFGNAKDIGEGNIRAVGMGHLIQLRFWGTHPERKYAKTFPKGKLHLAMGWMAACLQDYAGFQPTQAQAAYRDKPIYVNDADLLRGARLETLFRNGGRQLIQGWDKILAKNPDNPYLFDRWLAVLDDRSDTDHLGLIRDFAAKDPSNTFSKLDLAYQCYEAEQYDEGVSVCFQELARDNDDPDWWDLAAKCLWAKNDYEETIRLLKTWTELHPDNQEAWLGLVDYYEDWAWVARGDGWAKDVTKEGWRLMGERMALAEKAALQASVVAQGIAGSGPNSWAWGTVWITPRIA